MNTKNILGGILIGAVLGVAAGLMLAPSSGRKSREKLSKEARRLKRQLFNAADRSVDSLKEGYNKKIDAYASTGKHSIDSLKEKIKI